MQIPSLTLSTNNSVLMSEVHEFCEYHDLSYKIRAAEKDYKFFFGNSTDRQIVFDKFPLMRYTSG